MPGSGSSIADRLAAHLRAGTLLDLAPDRAVGTLLDETEMRAWDLDHDVNADLLRDLLRGRGICGDPDPRGIRLRGARICGRLDLDHVSTTITLILEDCLLDHGLTAEAAHLPALVLRRCRLAHPIESALSGEGLRVDHLISLAGSALAADTTAGTIHLLGVRIGNQFGCKGALVHNPAGPALAADDLQTEGTVFLDEGFTANGTGESGAVRLVSARIGGQLICTGATLRNPTGAALAADRLQTEGDAFLDNGFTAEGGGLATIRLLNARIGRRLCCRLSTVTSRSDPQHRWSLDGLTYTEVPLLDPDGRDWEAWLGLLRNATPYYTSQPYQQLAAVYRGLGHDSDVRASLIAQRRDQLSRGALTRPADRWWARLTGVLLGYGYQPWRVLLYLASVLIVSVVLALVLGGHGALARTVESSTAPSPSGAGAPMGSPPTRTVEVKPCTPIQMIGKGLDLGTPFLPSSRSGVGSCVITASYSGDALTISRWILQLAAWALAALFIAGFTGIVRKT